MEEIFELFGQGLADAIPSSQKYMKAILNIMRIDKVAEFNGYLIDKQDKKINLEIKLAYTHAKAVHKLHEITQSHPLEHRNWNRAIFTLYPDGKFEIEYIWDQELQDEIEKYDKESQR